MVHVVMVMKARPRTRAAASPRGTAVVLVDAGFLNPIIAAAAMALSSLSVISNSALLKRLRIGSLEP